MNCSASCKSMPLLPRSSVRVGVTLNTDDPAISNITLSDEFELTACEYHLKPGEVRELLMNAAGAVFGEKSLRRELAAEFERMELA